MFTAERFFVVLIVCGILLDRNPVNGYRGSCPKPAVVDLAEGTPDSSGAVNKSGIFFPRETVQYDDDGRFGCMCDIKICVPFCCPLGAAADPNGCVGDKNTSLFSYLERFWKTDTSLVIVHDPCQLRFFKRTSMKKYNNLLRDNIPVDTHFRKHCILREVDSVEYLYGFCLDGRSILGLLFSKSMNAWSITCEIVSVFFILVTLIVYSVTPELKNLQGLLLRCYIGSKLTHYVLYHVTSIWIAGSTFTYTILLWVTGIATFYFTYAAIFWLTMMNFDVWWKFRSFQSNRHCNVKEYEKSRFLRYSICTWGGSLIVASIALGCFTWIEVADPLTRSTLDSMYLTLDGVGVLIMIIWVSFSIYTFTSTALTIRRQKKKIAGAVDDVDRNRKDDANKQSINVYFALFTLMGCDEVFHVVHLFGHDPMYRQIYVALGPLHAILTFFIFAWTDDVKRSFRIQVIKMLQSRGACRQFHATPVIENRKENL